MEATKERTEEKEWSCCASEDATTMDVFGATKMTESQFKAAYVANFLSSYMAARQNKIYPQGFTPDPLPRQPVADAIIYANTAWHQLSVLEKELEAFMKYELKTNKRDLEIIETLKKIVDVTE